MSDIEQLRTGATAILLVALVAGVGVIVLGEFQINQEVVVGVVNESINITASGTWIYLRQNSTGVSYYMSMSNSSVSLTNTTHNFSINNQAGNFSTDTTLGRIMIDDTGRINGSRLNSSGGSALWNVSYSYTHGDAARDTFGDGVLGVQEITGWLDIIALALVLGVVVAFVMKAIYDRNLPRQGY